MKASDDFQVFVKPVGAQCNLACEYCYYLEKESLYPTEDRFRMDDGVLESYIHQHILATEGHDIFFSWHGGEPMMAGLDYFKGIVAIQKKYRPTNSRIINGIQTNGTLLDEEWCTFLASENFVVGISIDGPEELHSAYRHSMDGKSIFNRTLRGYRLLQSYRIPCEVLCVVNAVNVSQPLKVYRYFKELDARYITFLPLVERKTTQSGMVSSRSVDPKAFGEFMVAVFDEWKASDIGIIKIQMVEEALRTAFGLEHTLCIFKKVCGRVPVVELNGDFYSCDHFVDPSHRVGNILHSSLVDLLESDHQRLFGQAKQSLLPAYCLGCEVLDMCNGACPKDRFMLTPDGQPGLNYLCEGYRLFFNHCKPFVDTVAQVWKSGKQ